MSPLPERWVLLHENEPVQDEDSGNWVPATRTEHPWTGLLQQRQLSASSVDAGNVEILDGHEVSSYVLLLDPGLDPFPQRLDGPARTNERRGAVSARLRPEHTARLRPLDFQQQRVSRPGAARGRASS